MVIVRILLETMKHPVSLTHGLVAVNGCTVLLYPSTCKPALQRVGGTVGVPVSHCPPYYS